MLGRPAGGGSASDSTTGKDSVGAVMFLVTIEPAVMEPYGKALWLLVC